MRKRNRQRQHGSTVIEVMAAAVILLVAIVGLVAVMNTAASATAVGHRRTVGAHIRQAVIDRILVTPRDRLETFASETWIIDGCYDADSRQPSASYVNAGRTTSFSCPDGSRYRTWFRVEPDVDPMARRWTVLTYAERMNGADAGCTPDTRFSSVACLGADLLLTD
jgi:hypothetical protein